MRVSELQLNFARDRTAVISAIVPQDGHTCVDRPHMPCFACKLPARLEMYHDDEGVICDVFLGETRIESFYPSEFMP
jgi:hypothetical protein